MKIVDKIMVVSALLMALAIIYVCVKTVKRAEQEQPIAATRVVDCSYYLDGYRVDTACVNWQATYTQTGVRRL